MYISKNKEGRTIFNEGIVVMWADATQEELKAIYDLGYTNFVTKEENAESKKSNSKAKKAKNKASDKE
jgi:hypothetical protein